MHILTAELGKVGHNSIFRRRYTGSFCPIEELIIDCSFVLRSEQVRDHTRVQKIVDIFKEGLKDNLCVGEKELHNLIFKRAFLE